MVVTCYVKLFRTGADRRDGILMSLIKLTKHYSVTELLRSDPKNDTGAFPESSDTKEINHNLFKSKV